MYLAPLPDKKSPRGIYLELCAPEDPQPSVATRNAADHYWATAWESLDAGLLMQADVEHTCWATLERVACLALLRVMHDRWANVPSLKLNLSTLPVHDGCAPEVLDALSKAHAQAKKISGGPGALNALREGVVKRLIEGHDDLTPSFGNDPYAPYAAANPRVQNAVDAVYKAVRAAVNSSWPACGAALRHMWPKLIKALEKPDPRDHPTA